MWFIIFTAFKHETPIIQETVNLPCALARSAGIYNERNVRLTLNQLRSFAFAIQRLIWNRIEFTCHTGSAFHLRAPLRGCTVKFRGCKCDKDPLTHPHTHTRSPACIFYGLYVCTHAHVYTHIHFYPAMAFGTFKWLPTKRHILNFAFRSRHMGNIALRPARFIDSSMGWWNWRRFT